MTLFPKKRLNGVDYDLAHLSTFIFDVVCEGEGIAVEVEFTCHCFTRALADDDTPDVHYRHAGELRAFCPDRFELSKALPNYFRNLGTATIYLNSKGGFFFWRTADGQPYLIFFSAVRMDRSAAAKVRIRVRSAHRKPGMAQRGQAVRFATMVRLVANGQKIPQGQMVHIKRK